MPNKTDFELIEERSLPELNSVGRLYRHTKTGARLLSILNDDENKVFSINFRTTPHDSTGVAHIMEHSVLNGSEKYPVKEPFVELIKGSLQTFVNALTFPDKTCYPVASQNLQDFYNLIDVYIDATLHPLIRPHILDQEGWHYEVDEETGNLIYKGVVFNEMKGVYSDPNSLLGEMSQQSLFPDTLYSFDSGGDPVNIPDLTYEQFKHFHETYYHPSNAYIFWYGDDPEEARLEKLAQYLDGYTALEVDSVIPLQPPFDETVHVTVPYAVSDEDDPKYYVSANWVLGDKPDPNDAMGLSILSHILLGTSASPLRKALIDSGYGEDVVGQGLSSQLRQITFSVGLKGVQPESTAKVEDLIYTTIADLAENGIDPQMVAASMNTVEFALRENNTGPYPRGLMLMLRAMSTWLYDGDPFEALAYEAPLEYVKLGATEGGYFEGLLKKYFLENTHRSTVILEPDPDLNQQQDEEEAARLKAYQDSLTPEEIEKLAAHAQDMKKIQETPDSPEALATLPFLTLADLDKENKTIPLEVLEENGIKLLYHDLFTNGVVYFDLSFDLHAVPQELLPYLGLFASGLVKMGTEKEDYVQLSQRIGQETGGVGPALFISNKFHAEDEIARLAVRGKSTVEKFGAMLDIMADILLTTDFDRQDRFRQILIERKARMESGLIPGGHGVVNRRLASAFSTAGWLSEQTNGLDNLFFTRKLLDEIETDWGGVVAKFNQIRDLVVNRKTLLLNVTLDAENWQKIRPQLSSWTAVFPEKDVETAVWQPSAPAPAEGWTIPAQVNYVGKGANLYALGYQPNGAISVISKYLGTTYIWEKIRVQGGAYGGFFLFDLFSGACNFLSYRDPNLNKTLDNYDGTVNFLRNLELSESELVKSIIGTIGNMDAYQLPDAKGYASMVRYLSGYTDEMRQQIREQILAATEADFRNLADVLEKAQAMSNVVVLGSADDIAEANEERDGFLTVRPVM
ncbi:insulinase family protein [bacterium]|nr:insulinase family protein [bacterium]MCB2179404.1 insulinase family protein [bacterium]